MIISNVAVSSLLDGNCVLDQSWELWTHNSLGGLYVWMDSVGGLAGVGGKSKNCLA